MNLSTFFATLPITVKGMGGIFIVTIIIIAVIYLLSLTDKKQ